MLQKGDTIGIIALSGECDREKVLNSKTFFENLGYKIKLSKNIFECDRYLAGKDENKLNELYDFFQNPEIKLILCARGGYGAIRLVNEIDYDLIKKNPKPFCGFSDVTALLLMIYKKSGIITYHAPMACVDFVENAPIGLTFTQENFFKTLNGEINSYNADKIYKNGLAEGILFGGNLSTVVSLCGLDFLPDEDFIFFAEDVNEPVYKIDRMFQQLINTAKFKSNCKGLIIGEFSGTDNEEWLDMYFYELTDKLNIPIVSMSKITHSKDKITLPIGVKAKILNDKFSFTI